MRHVFLLHEGEGKRDARLRMSVGEAMEDITRDKEFFFLFLNLSAVLIVRPILKKKTAGKFAFI